MNTLRALCASFALLAAASTGCALFSRPEPLTTLQLRFPSQTANHELLSAWPESLALDSLVADSAISGNRVIVFDGAKVLQFTGLRWVDTPAVMLTEQFKHWQAQSEAIHRRPGKAYLALSFSDFSIHLKADKNTVVVSSSAELRCATGSKKTLGIFSSQQPLRKMDAQTIAVTFAYASEATAKKMFSAAKLALPDCD